MTRFKQSKTRSVLAVLLSVAMLFSLTPQTAEVAQADGGDFSLDFAAAAPQSYDHQTGGGAFDDGTNGKNKDIVESLEGGDFSCGDIVTLFTKVSVDASADAGSYQTIELDYEFLMDTTGASGVAIGDISRAEVNYSPVTDLIAGENSTEDAMIDDGGSIAALISEYKSGTIYTPKSTLHGTVKITDLEPGEVVIVRIDVRIFCKAGSNPTGNLQCAITGGRVTEANGSPITPDAISVGNQTIPFLHVGDIHTPELNIEKTVTTSEGNTDTDDENLVISSGDTVKYLYVVTNPSNLTNPPGAPLYNVSVMDDNHTPGDTSDDFPVALTGLTDIDHDGIADDLAAGATAYGEALVTITEATGGTYTNTATAKGYSSSSYPDPMLTDSDTASVEVLPMPEITVTKTANPASVPETGADVTFTITVQNTGLVPVTLTGATDTVFGAIPLASFDKTYLLANETATYSFTQWIASDTLTAHQNTVSVTAEDDRQHPAEDSDDATVTIDDILPVITVTKTGSISAVPETGGDVTFTFTVTNNSAEPVTITSLSDDTFGVLAGDSDCMVGTVLQAGESRSFEAVFAIPAGDFPGTHVNIFTATAVDNDGSTASASASETISYTDVLPDISVTKTGSPDTVPETGGNVTFTFTVTNNGLEAATITSLVDDRFGTLAGDADCMAGTVLQAGESRSFEAAFAIPAGDFPGTHVNVFTAAAADDDGNSDSASDTETITYTDVLPDITVTKTGNPASVPETGGFVTFTFEVTNNSSEAATIISLTDSEFGILAGDEDCAPGTVLQAGESRSFEAEFFIPAGDVPGAHTNIFTVVVSDGDGNTGTASDEEAISYTDVLPDISVTKTGTPLIVPENGGSVTFTYVVSNNSDEAATITSLVDDKFGILAGDEDCKVGTILPPKSSKSFQAIFYVPAASAPGTHVNIFTAIASDDEGNTDTASDNETIDYAGISVVKTGTFNAGADGFADVGEEITYTFTVTNKGNVVLTGVTLTDTIVGPVTLSATTIPVGGSVTGTAAYKVTQADIDAGFVKNIATADSEQTGRAAAEHTTSLSQNPGLKVEKSGTLNAGADGSTDVGELITYVFKVTNTGNVTLTGVTVTDSVLGTITLSATTIPVGGFVTGTAAYKVTQADIDKGKVYNLATADSNQTGTATADYTTILPKVLGAVYVLPKTGTEYAAPLFWALGFLMIAGGMLGIFVTRNKKS